MAKDNGTDNGTIEFNMDALKQMKTREMGLLMRPTDVEKVAELLARVVTHCPYGVASDPETYLEIPYDDGSEGSFRSTLDALGEALKKQRKS